MKSNLTETIRKAQEDAKLLGEKIGFEIGFQKGFEIGFKQGLEQGKQRVKEKQIEIAKNMLKTTYLSILLQKSLTFN